jgi:hypothetical protein
MSLGRAGTPNPGLPPAVRGATLIGLAVIGGIIGLQILDDSGTGTTEIVVTTVPGATTVPGQTTTGQTAAATTRAPATTARAGTTTSRASAATTVKTRKNSEVKVVVYNASGLQGAAGNMRDKLKSLGYNVIGTDNLKPERTGTTVQCRSGFDAEAAKLAGQGVANAAQVLPFPTNPPEGSSEADCIVILGKT